MKFHGVEMVGPLYLQLVNDLPAGAEHQYRLVYSSDGNIYFNDGTQWIRVVDELETNVFFRIENNFSELPSDPSTARENLGIEGSGATYNVEYIIKWSVKSTNFTASAFNGYIIDGGITGTLPASPSTGDYIAFSPGGNIENNNSTLDTQGNNVMGESGNLTIDKTVPFALVYKDASWGWALA